MNIETANKLLQFRKKSGLSQEELASKIGVSRQAVSKWERAEASPDTDNLILLAKVYGVTLDELLTGNPEDVLNKEKENLEETTSEENTQTETSENKSKVSFKNGIHVDDGKDKVDISFRNGIHVDSHDGAKVHIDHNGINVVDEKGNQKVYTDEDGNVHGDKDYKKNGKKNPAMEFPIWLVSVIAFFLFGFLNILGGWATSWLWFLVIPLYYTTVKAIQKKKVNIFCYPVFITWLYLAIGMYSKIWHPTWLLFITIPFFYYIANIIDNKNHPQEDINIEQDGYSATVTTVEPVKKSHILRNTLIVIGSVICACILFVSVSLLFGKSGHYTKIYRINVPKNQLIHTVNLNNSSGEVNFYKSALGYSYIEYKCEYKGYFGDIGNNVEISNNDKGIMDIDTNENSGFGYFKEISNIYIGDDLYYKADKNFREANKFYNGDKYLNIENGSGTVSMKNDLGISNILLDISSGECYLSNLKCSAITSELASGSIYFDNVNSKEVNSTVSSGSFIGKNLNINSLKAVTKSGKTDLQGNFNKTDVNVSSGSTDLNCKSIPNNSDIDISSGSVDYIIPDAVNGFALNYEKSSGSIDSEFKLNNSLDGSKGNATYNKGKNQINVKISSGSLDLIKTK